MADQDKTNEQHKYPTSFGLFYPVGYLVVGFKNKEGALRVQKDLLTGGYEPDDYAFFSCKEVSEAAKLLQSAPQSCEALRTNWSS